MATQCEVCGEGFVVEVEDVDETRYYNCDTCGSDYCTSEQISYNLTIGQEE